MAERKGTPDDVLLNKAAIIERTLARIAEDYTGYEGALATEFLRQDAIILNLQRACQAAIDGAMRLVRTHALGLPQDSRDAFTMLEKATLIDAQTATRLRAMVGFRNIAVHDYQTLSLPVLEAILRDHLNDLRDFARLLVGWGTRPSS
jgi:uncharacterized protein YutE (UPF0331/DUF86 family)